MTAVNGEGGAHYAHYAHGDTSQRAVAQRQLRVVETAAALREALDAPRRAGASIGFVPTMGALHAGHHALVERARRDCDVVVVSIFVNPLQFGPAEDYLRYPRPLDADIAGLRERGVELAFVPTAEEMWPTPPRVRLVVEPPLGSTLEAASRPGHFDGMASVVAKLLSLLAPHRAYFGQKDAQQVAVVRALVKDLGLPVAVVACPTVRAADGLALSSRNAYLDPTQRRLATTLVHALDAGHAAFQGGVRTAEGVRAPAAALLDHGSFQVEYLEVVDATTFVPASTVVHGNLLVGAMRLGATRLLDNVVLGVDRGDEA